MSAGLVTAIATDGREARSALTPSERATCASIAGAQQRRNWRAGRLAAKRAVQQMVDESEARQIDVGSSRAAPPTLMILDAEGRRRELEVVVSISHRDGRAVAAAVPGGLRVGVDLEPARAVPRRLARYFLSREELGRAGCGDVTVLWTLKEAVWKALRLGGEMPFKDLELCCGPSGALRGVKLRGAFLPMRADVCAPWPDYVMSTVWAKGAVR